LCKKKRNFFSSEKSQNVFLFSLSKKLKGLFTLFAGHIIQHSAAILNQLNSSKNENASTTTTTTTTDFKIQFRKKNAEENQFELLNAVLGTLSNLCLFDSVGFITDERFQLLMMPIVDQVKKLKKIFRFFFLKNDKILVGKFDVNGKIFVVDRRICYASNCSFDQRNERRNTLATNSLSNSVENSIEFSENSSRVSSRFERNFEKTRRQLSKFIS
jgi:hypothetical protein